LDREITRAEAEASGLSIKGNERTCPTPDHPMGGINWYDAVAFCRWLGQQAGFSEDEQAYPDPATLDARQYPADPSPAANGAPLNWPLRLDRGGFRLPTEQEWEIACRRDTGSSYGYGRDSALLDRYAWFTESSKGGGRLPRELRPNLRGLFDMHGNVWEWCHDWYGEYASSDAVDPIRTAGGSYRVYRGGSWSSASRLCRSADRYGDAPANRTGDVGFRVAQVPSGKPEVSGAGSGSR
jgi:formylglycine-generating enzyme required for sulfatase activity